MTSILTQTVIAEGIGLIDHLKHIDCGHILLWYL